MASCSGSETAKVLKVDREQALSEQKAWGRCRNSEPGDTLQTPGAGGKPPFIPVPSSVIRGERLLEFGLTFLSGSAGCRWQGLATHLSISSLDKTR